jgi:hypothetical protein
MVTIINFKKRKNTKDEEFLTLELQGEVEMIRAVNTGKYYAHARTATITTTLNELTCKALVGTKFPGLIKKVECEEYSYLVPGTKDTIILNHQYQYIAENANVEEAVFSGGIS